MHLKLVRENSMEFYRSHCTMVPLVQTIDFKFDSATQL